MPLHVSSTVVLIMKSKLYYASGTIIPDRPVHRLREESFFKLCTGRPGVMMPDAV